MRNNQSVSYNRDINNQSNKANLRLAKRKHARVLGLAPLQAVMILIFLIFMISFLIYSKVVLDKIGIDIVSYEKKYEDLVDEKVKLELDMESNISLKNLEALARERGLSSVQDYQIEYVNFKVKDNIEVVRKKGDRYKPIKNFFDKVMAYIK